MTRDEFADLAVGHLEEIAAFVRRHAASAADADDAVQTTYARAFSSWSDLRDPRSCRAWLFRIARNVLLDVARAEAFPIPHGQ